MTTIQLNTPDLDLFAVNWDYSGRRILNDSREIVDFRNGSTIRIWYNTQPIDYETHHHTALEIILPVDNVYDVTVRDVRFHLEPGDLLIIPSGQPHALYAPPDGSRFVFLFDPEPLCHLKDFAALAPFLAHPLFFTHKAQQPDNLYGNLLTMLLQMIHQYFSPNEYSEFLVYSQFLNFLAALGHSQLQTSSFFPQARLYKQKEYIQRFSRLIEYLDVHYTDNLDLNEVSAMTGFSKYHFARLFKQYTNMTFCDYLGQLRLSAAEELLKQPDLSITEIALQSGFSSISTFNRMFRKYKNCTPSEYRLQHMNLRC